MCRVSLVACVGLAPHLHESIVFSFSTCIFSNRCGGYKCREEAATEGRSGTEMRSGTKIHQSRDKQQNVQTRTSGRSSNHSYMYTAREDQLLVSSVLSPYAYASTSGGGGALYGISFAGGGSLGGIFMAGAGVLDTAAH